MKSTVVKRSIMLAGHKTSVSLEDPFWEGSKEIAKDQRKTLSDLALLWQIYSRRCCVSIQVRQYGHRRGLDRMMRSTMACRTAGNVG